MKYRLQTFCNLIVVAILYAVVFTVGAIARVLWPIKPVALLLLASVLLSSCAGTDAVQTVTSRVLPNGQTETVTTSAPYEKPMDRAIANGIPALMEAKF